MRRKQASPLARKNAAKADKRAEARTHFKKNEFRLFARFWRLHADWQNYPKKQLKRLKRPCEAFVCHKKKGTKMTKRKRNVSVSFRTTKEESDKIHELADRAGVTLSEYLVSSALGKEIVRFDDLNEFTKELKSQGKNLNQLAVLAHTGKIKCANIDFVIELYGRIYQRIKETLERRKSNGNNNRNQQT